MGVFNMTKDEKYEEMLKVLREIAKDECIVDDTTYCCVAEDCLNRIGELLE